MTAALTIAGKGKKGSSKVRVFNTVQDARDAGFAVDNGDDGFYEPTTKTVGIFAEKVSNVPRALWVAFHEQSMHHGLRQTFPDSAALDAELTRAGQNPTVRAVADALAVERELGKGQDNLAVEEALAELQAAHRTGNWSEIESRYGVKADGLVKRGIADVMRRLLRAIRTAIGKNSGAYSDADVMALLEDSHKAGLQPEKAYNGRHERTRPAPERLAQDGRLPADRGGVERVRERLASTQAQVSRTERHADGGRERAPGRNGAGSQAGLAGARSGVALPGYSERMRGIDGPDPKIVAVADAYARANNIPSNRQREYAQVDHERATRIANAYAEMPHAPQDPKVREAYENLIRQTRAQYDALVDAGYKFWLMDPAADPYNGNPASALRDLRATQSMAVFPTEAGFGSDASFDPADNPLLEDTGLTWPYGSMDGEPRTVYANDLFRAVHDAFGHGLEGAGFRAQGEENAWQAHARLFTGSALGALTSETRGQNSYLNYGPNGETNRTASVDDTKFADQKTGLMPEWTWTEGRDMGAVQSPREEGAAREQQVLASRRVQDRPARLRSAGGRSDAGRNQGARGQPGRVRSQEDRGGESWVQRARQADAVTVRGIKKRGQVHFRT